MVEKRCKYRLLVLVLGNNKYGTMVGNVAVQWTMPEDPQGYEKSIPAKDSSFNQSKKEKIHTRKIIEYKTHGGRGKYQNLHVTSSRGTIFIRYS